MRLGHLLTGTALGLALLLAGPADAKNTFRWASQGDALTLDPYSQNEGPTTAMALHMHDTLVARNDKLEKTPGLATSWQAVEPTVWEFKLRAGVKFHDGTPLTADDVVFSINRALGAGSDFKSYVNAIKEAKAVDSTTVRFTTEKPSPLLPDNLSSVAIMSKAWCEKHDAVKAQDFKAKEETFTVRNAMGSGPYKLVSREPDLKTVLEKNPDWWGWKEKYPENNIDEIVYTPVKNPATRVAALLSGELEFVLDPPLQDLERVKSTPSLTVKQTAQDRSIFFGLDEASPELRTSDIKGKNPFHDQRVRQAMYQAIDIDAIKQKVMRGLSEPGGIVAAPAIRGWSKELDTRLPYDPNAAKKLLAEAGYPNGFSVRLDCPNDRYINDESICQAAVAMLGRIGIKVSLEAVTKTLHFPKIQNNKSDFYMLGWGVPTLDSGYVFEHLASSAATNKSSWNFTGYSNPKVDKLTAAMAVELDTAKRDQIIAEAWKVFKADQPYIPLHNQVISWAMSKKVDMPIRANDAPAIWMAKMVAPGN